MPIEIVLPCENFKSLILNIKVGFHRYILDKTDELKLKYFQKLERTNIVEPFSGTNCAAIVTQTSPQELKVWDMEKSEEIHQLSFFSKNVLAVRMNKSRLVVCLIDEIHIFERLKMEELCVITYPWSNPRRLCELSTSDDSLLAYPASEINGTVQIYDAKYTRTTIRISAHKNPLSALAFSTSGSMIATTSINGMVIRVFSAINGMRLFECSRGLTANFVEINCLSFSQCDSFLCCSSSNGEVNVFEIEKEESFGIPTERSWMSSLLSIFFRSVDGFIGQVSATYKLFLPINGLVNSVLSIVIVNNQLRLLVATEEAILYVYIINPDISRQLTLSKTFHLDNETEIDASWVKLEVPGSSQGSSEQTPTKIWKSMLSLLGQDF